MASTLALESDYSTFRSDGTYGLTYTRIYGARVPLEGVVRRWLVAPGELLGDPMAGLLTNVSRIRNANHSDRDLKVIQRSLENEARQVNYVTGASVAVTNKGLIQGVLVNGRITLTDGITYAMSITATATAVLLTQFPDTVLR